MALLEITGACKRFGGVQALDEAHFTADAGEVHALLGPNGSGKSTLTKILTGVVVPDRASIRIAGREITVGGPRDAHNLGVAAVYQQLSVIDDLTVAQNLVLGVEPQKSLGFLDERATRTTAVGILDRFRNAFSDALPLDRPVAALDPGERQIVEICKALARQPRILVLDEATASLHKEQVTILFDVVRELRQRGVLIVFTSHRLDEVFAVADRATVLRGGRTVGTLQMATASEADLVSLMVGEFRPQPVVHQSPTQRAPVLEVRDLSTNRLRHVSFTVRKGEVLGLGGLQGQGQSELLLALFGATSRRSGDVLLAGERLSLATPIKAARAGVALVPGDRGRQGLFAVRSIQENLSLASLTKRAVAGFVLRRGAERTAARRVVDQLKIKIGKLSDPVSTLSGGNQQKVIVGKWLLNEPRVVLLDDPTKGVDVGAKAELYAIMRELTDAGVAVIFNSSDNRELLEQSDRILVLFEGAIVDELSGERLTEQALVSAALQVAPEEAS